MEFVSKYIKFFKIGEVIQIEEELFRINSMKFRRPGKHGYGKWTMQLISLLTGRTKTQILKARTYGQHLECTKVTYLIQKMDADFLYLKGKGSELERRKLPSKYLYDDIYSQLKNGTELKMEEFSYKDEIISLLLTEN
ncbi:eukaryotic translation initiation factor 5a [Anaeramoeba flamelloides]|uniref:Eukaryotic translation initiation factor 5a n=1 Tax=Anaeramoeba flamelloides TaxID=1746091 RepID=A0AAV7Z1A0_9EUKA|nr:eukaryotic translation initiation factor 5a [Anaeramoeba flamelloides]